MDLPPADVPTHAAADLNANPQTAEVQRVKYREFDDREVAKWTPEDLIKTLETVGRWKDRGYYFISVPESKELLAIVSDKLSSWEKEGSISYDQTDKIIHLLAERPLGSDGGLLNNAARLGCRSEVVDFLKEVALWGKKDKRYYDLMELLLTNQALGDSAHPLAAILSQSPRSNKIFEEKVFNNLSPEVQNRLSKETYYYDFEGRTYCYALLTGKLVSID